MPPMYLQRGRRYRLDYFRDEWEHAPLATRAITELYRRHAGNKDWDDQCCRPLLFSYRNSIPGSTSGHVARASAAYDHEDQALRKTQELLSFT